MEDDGNGTDEEHGEEIAPSVLMEGEKVHEHESVLIKGEKVDELDALQPIGLMDGQ